MTPTNSRRERPAKPALSREWIIAETIAIARRDGLDRATMRRVAQALDTGQSSLYVYVANTAELHTAVLDELVGSALPESGAPVASGAWRSDLEALLASYADVLFAFPGLARAALVLTPTGPNMLRLHDRLIGLMIDGGIEPARAAWGATLLVQNVTASAAEHSTPTSTDIDAPGDPDADWSALTDAVRSADPAVAPHLAAQADAVLSGTPAQRSTWMIGVLLAGIASTPVPGGTIS
jgi:AcrR family transcriptional regulator